MPYKHFEPVSKQLTIVVGLTVVGFMAFGLALSYYRNALFEQTLANIKKGNEELRLQVEEGKRDLEYYRSTQYKDKYAKGNLGRVTPGEKVLIITKIPESTVQELLDESIKDVREAAYLELLRQMPVLEHWKLYFFHPEKIDELKTGA